MKQALLGCALLMALFFAGLAQAQPQGQMGANGGMNKGNAVGQHHPNLEAAQHHIEAARDKLDAAQKANEYDMGGHASKAKELLDQAYVEIKQAAESANANKKK
ncbi:MAG TPA: hypothetical protein VF753_03515 [Terriglobales bacterium]